MIESGVVDDEPALAQRYNVRSIPTLVVLRDGRFVGKASGLVTAEPLVAALDQLSGG